MLLRGQLRRRQVPPRTHTHTRAHTRPQAARARQPARRSRAGPSHRARPAVRRRAAGPARHLYGAGRSRRCAVRQWCGAVGQEGALGAESVLPVLTALTALPVLPVLTVLPVPWQVQHGRLLRVRLLRMVALRCERLRQAGRRLWGWEVAVHMCVLGGPFMINDGGLQRWYRECSVFDSWGG